MLWHRFIRHTYATDNIIALPFLIMRSSHECTMFLRRYFSSYSVTCDVCMANQSCYESVAIFLNMFEIIITPFRTLANKAIVQRISYDSFRCCDVAVAYCAIRDTLYVRKPIRKGVRAVLGNISLGKDFFFRK